MDDPIEDTTTPSSSPSQTRISFVSALSGYLRVLPCRLLYTVLTAAVVVTAAVAVVSLGVYVVSRKSDLFKSSAALSFCCPEDAQEAVRFLNRSNDPCHDFYTRVCSKGLRFRLWKQLARESELEKIVVTGVVPRGMRAAEGTNFLTAYYKTCIEAIPHKQGFISNLAPVLARETHRFLAKPDSWNALAYAATVWLKYRLLTAVEVYYEPRVPLAELTVAIVCSLEALHPAVMTSSVKAVADLAIASVTPDGVKALVAEICGRFRSDNANMAWRDTGDVLKRTRWHVDGLRFALASVGYTIDGNTRISVKGVAGVLAVHDVYADADHHAGDGNKAAYLLFHSVASGTHELYKSYGGSPDRIPEICKASVQDIGEVWDMFTAEHLTTPEKEDWLRDVFATVRDTVYHECRTSHIFDAEDSARLEDFFDKLSLSVTTGASRSTNVALKPAAVFAENLLKGRAYDFRVRRDSQQGTEFLKFPQARYIWIPPVMLDLVRTGSAKSSEIPNMAALGWLIAQAVWDVVLSGHLWSPKTEAEIKRLWSCFNPEESGMNESVSVPLVLGMSSVLKSFSRPDWDQSRPAVGQLRMSHGELFYTLALLSSCPLDTTPQRVRQLNAALMHAGDFASVFRCAADSPMAEKPRCSL
ncbi:hypothetical protein HPB49_001509 [Dermacentor silvarum]|uniref:Uncharacterized protein n=1 Tax=Dermacentor silvarum TaxID=543639 RepID=A0ACB8DM65_DERSI|nr:hypothetical protein HPB49_001509 [Dermacentor silvarum]